MDSVPPGTISPGAIDGSHGSFSMDDYSSSHDDQGIQGFLMLKFPDGMWLMRSSTVVLGRDEALKRTIQDRASLRVQTDQELPESDFPQSPGSEDSGNASEDEEHPGGTKFKYSHCGGFRTSLPGQPANTEGADDEPFLPVHPPVDSTTGEMERLTAISKKHARIQVEKNGVFIEVLGRNGLFVDSHFLEYAARKRLEDTSEVCIGGLNFEVVLDEVRVYGDQIGDEDVMEMSSGEEEEEEVEAEASAPESGSESQLGARQVTASEEAEETKPTLKIPKSKPAKPITLTALHKRQENDTEEDLRARLQSILPPGETLERRKGPGRPPANGLISKRQISELMKKKKLLDDGAAADVSTELAKVAASIDADDETAAKTKTKKRKRSDSAADGKNADGERKKPEEPPRSPSPTEDQFTPAQLEKPDLTYALMIFKILNEVKPTQLNLQQLYKEVKNRWPYYRFKKDTTGWESSVRHTIKQHYFKQGERDGKGYKYTINTDVEAPTQKSKPAPTAAQPAPYSNGQYRPPQYPHYGAPHSAGGYRAPYPSQTPYSYQVPGQRPAVNGAGQTAQYATQFGQPPTSGFRPTPSQTPQTGPGQNSTLSSVSLSGQAAAPSSSYNVPATAAGQPFRPPSKPPATTQTAGTGPQTSLQPPTAFAGVPPQENVSGAAQTTASGSALPATFTSHRSFQTTNSASPAPGPPTSAPNTAQGPSSMASGQQFSRSSSQPHAANGVEPSGAPPAAPPIVRPLPSEEIKNGVVPQVLTDFVNNMKKLCKDLPPPTVNESVRRAEDAIDWVMKNLHGDPNSEPGRSPMWQHLVRLVQDTIINHDRQERIRRGEQVPPTPPPKSQAPPTLQATQAAVSPATLAPTQQPQGGEPAKDAQPAKGVQPASSTDSAPAPAPAQPPPPVNDAKPEAPST